MRTTTLLEMKKTIQPWCLDELSSRCVECWYKATKLCHALIRLRHFLKPTSSIGFLPTMSIGQSVLICCHNYSHIGSAFLCNTFHPFHLVSLFAPKTSCIRKNHPKAKAGTMLSLSTATVFIGNAFLGAMGIDLDQWWGGITRWFQAENNTLFHKWFLRLMEEIRRNITGKSKSRAVGFS